MQHANFLPATEVASIQAFPEIQYLPGAPRAYRFDAKAGRFNFRGETQLTNRGEAFAFIPIAYRFFAGEVLGYDHRNWVEFYFINQLGQVCSLLFHGYSVDNLRPTFADMHYDRIDFTQVKLTVLPEQRTNQHGSYFLASFSYEVLPTEDGQVLQAITAALPPLYREDTLVTLDATTLKQNYDPPEVQQLATKAA